MVTLVTCPTCGAQSAYTPNNHFRPFCSERCKLIDLGQWATESYRIPQTGIPETPEDEH
jgi:endogenous inhibitor of DNA gyrase (YacG/DUF329 family)